MSNVISFTKENPTEDQALLVDDWEWLPLYLYKAQYWVTLPDLRDRLHGGQFVYIKQDNGKFKPELAPHMMGRKLKKIENVNNFIIMAISEINFEKRSQGIKKDSPLFLKKPEGEKGRAPTLITVREAKEICNKLAQPRPCFFESCIPQFKTFFDKYA